MVTQSERILIIDDEEVLREGCTQALAEKGYVTAKRGYALTADNARTESLAIPAMVPLYHRAVRRGGRTGALAACLWAPSPT